MPNKNAFRQHRGSGFISLAQGVMSYLVTNPTVVTSVANPPPKPAKPDLTNDLGTSTTDDLTHTQFPAFAGVGATPGATVTIFSDGVSIGTTTADAAGAWTFTATTAMDTGDYSITWQHGAGAAASEISHPLAIKIQAFTADTQWSSTTPDGTYLFDLDNTGTATSAEMVGGEVLIATFTSDGTTATSKVTMTTTADYTVDWGDGTKSTRASYADKNWGGATTARTVKVYSKSPLLVTGISGASSSYTSFVGSPILTKLRILSLAINKFVTPPTLPSEWVAMQQFQAHGNLLATAPAIPATWTALQILYLYDNKLTDWPTLHPQWVALRDFKIGSNLLTTVPALPPEWVEMRIFWFGRNKITVLPTLPSEWVAMQQFQANENLIATAPAIPATWTALQILYLYDNKLTDWPTLHPQWVALRDFKIGSNLLTTVPALPPEWVAMQIFWIGGNKITVLPTLPSQWVAMQQFNAQINLIATAPAIPATWTALQLLYLSDNKLTDVPTLHPQWVALRELRLGGNLLTTVPALPPEWVAMQSLLVNALPSVTAMPAIPLTWTAFKTFGASGTGFTAATLNTLLSTLGNVAFSATGKTLNISSNPGTSTVSSTDLASATARGWVVTT